MIGDPYQRGLKLSEAGRHAEAIDAFQAALALCPDDARTLFALAGTARALGMAGAAHTFYEKVLALHPGRLEAVVGKADLLREEGQAAAAIALLEPLLAREADSPHAWCTLGLAQRALDCRDLAEASFTRALQLAPDFSPALANLADCLADRGDLAGSLALYDRLLARDGAQHQARLNRAIVHFLLGDLKAGWRDYAARLKVPGQTPVTEHGLKPWSGGPLKRTRLLVTAEQGVGDQVMFASLLPELCARASDDGGQVIFECEPRLRSLFARSFPQVRVAACDWSGIAGVVRAHYGWLKSMGGANAAIELGTLPRYLRPALARFPAPNAYLVPDAAALCHWRDWASACGGHRRLGICWRSSKQGADRALQYAPLAAWAAFLKTCHGEIVSVQYDAQPEELAQLSALSGRTIHLPPELDQKADLDGACALLSALDAVISAPTAVSWLAAGAGVPTYKTLYGTSWTAFGCDHEPFAPACRVIGPAVPGDWQDVFAQVHAALQ